MQHRAFELIEGRDLRHVRNAADTGGHDHVAWTHHACLAIRQAQCHLPAPRRRVITPPLKIRRGPEVQLQCFDIGLEPVGQLVLWDVGGPACREGHIGHVIDLHLIVQGQRVIAQPPVVADAGITVDDQGIDPEMAEPRGNRQSGLTTAHHNHCRVAIRVGQRLGAQIGPVGTSKIAGVPGTLRALATRLLRVPVDLVEGGHQRPGTRPLGRRLKAQHTGAVTRRAVKAEKRLHASTPCTRHFGRRCAVGGKRQIGHALQRRPQGVHSRGLTTECLELPGERQQIAPMTVVGKEHPEGRLIVAIKRISQRCNPTQSNGLGRVHLPVRHDLPPIG